jgi:hypothetical protein
MSTLHDLELSAMSKNKTLKLFEKFVTWSVFAVKRRNVS